MRKRTELIIAAFIFALTGCASVEPDQEKAPVSTEMTISVENPQMPVTGQESKTAEDTTTIDDTYTGIYGTERRKSSVAVGF